MINVILAIILIMIAATLVSLVFRKPIEPDAPPVTTTTTMYVPVTTTTPKVTTTSTTTSTTTTTLDPATLLTPTNLAKCINRAGGKLISDPPRCVPCQHQRAVFVKDAADGQAAYDRLDKPTPSGGIPRWEFTKNGEFKKTIGCQSLKSLNSKSMFDCKLVPIPGHTYLTCFE
ncbi:MAG: hypothetical protein WAX07_03275 [Candidatus Altiarchaeia archaeon]